MLEPCMECSLGFLATEAVSAAREVIGTAGRAGPISRLLILTVPLVR